MLNYPWEYHLDMSPYSSSMVLQTHTSYDKIILMGIIFLFLWFLFILSTHPCMGLHCFLYISVAYKWISIQLVLLLILCMHYKYSNIQNYPITLSYSRAHFTQQSKRFHYWYLNYQFFIKFYRNTVILIFTVILQFHAKLLFWLWVMLSFSKFDSNYLHLCILLMHIPILNQVHVIHTYISYCFAFWNQWFMHSLSTNYATQHCRLLVPECTIFITLKLEL